MGPGLDVSKRLPDESPNGTYPSRCPRNNTTSSILRIRRDRNIHLIHLSFHQILASSACLPTLTRPIITPQHHKPFIPLTHMLAIRITKAQFTTLITRKPLTPIPGTQSRAGTRLRSKALIPVILAQVRRHSGTRHSRRDCNICVDLWFRIVP